MEALFGPMHTERYIRIVAGTFIMLTVLLGAKWSPIYVSEWALIFTAFVGANLFQFGLTDFCPMKNILIALGVKAGCEKCPKWEDIYASGAQTTVRKIWSVMDITRSIRTMAGTMILLSLVLGYFVSGYFYCFTLFVGANLFQFGFSRWCPMEIIMAAIGLRPAETSTKDMDVSPEKAKPATAASTVAVPAETEIV